jgi:hypothetical protein
MDRIGFAVSIRGYATDYIKFGDSKAGAVLTLTIAVSGKAPRKVGTVLVRGGNIRGAACHAE